jgi:hypothetical protein
MLLLLRLLLLLLLLCLTGRPRAKYVDVWK